MPQTPCTPGLREFLLKGTSAFLAVTLCIALIVPQAQAKAPEMFPVSLLLVRFLKSSLVTAVIPTQVEGKNIYLLHDTDSGAKQYIYYDAVGDKVTRIQVNGRLNFTGKSHTNQNTALVRGLFCALCVFISEPDEAQKQLGKLLTDFESNGYRVMREFDTGYVLITGSPSKNKKIIDVTFVGIPLNSGEAQRGMKKMRASEQ